MKSQNVVNIDSGNGLVPDGTKPLPEPMMTYCVWCTKEFYTLWYSCQSLKICFIFKITVTPLTDKWVKWTIEYFIWYVNCVLTQVNHVITSQVSKHNNHSLLLYHNILIYSNHVSRRILPLLGGHSLTYSGLAIEEYSNKLSHHWFG